MATSIDAAVVFIITVIEYAVVASLLTVSAVVLVRTIFDFFDTSASLPQSVVSAVDGILVVIILLDIVHTVFRHVRNAAFPVRPFLVIGILAAIRDILSASAHLTLSAHLGRAEVDTTLFELAAAVGAVVILLFGLWLLGVSGHQDAEV
ncbi:MAG: phosphate-starvation-inducible PsiE family protein [Acidimicrobiales bacterium]